MKPWLFLIAIFAVACASQPAGPSLSSKQSPGCWILASACPDDSADFDYFVGQIKLTETPQNALQQRRLRKGAQTVALAQYAAFLREQVSSKIESSSQCQGDQSEGLTCTAQVVEKIVATASARIRTGFYKVDQEYMDPETNEFYVRIKISKSTTAELMNRIELR